MPWAEMVSDMRQAISVFRELGVTVKGFRAPWLIANEDAYRAAQMHNLKYVSNVSAKKALQRLQIQSGGVANLSKRSGAPAEECG